LNIEKWVDRREADCWWKIHGRDVARTKFYLHERRDWNRTDKKYNGCPNLLYR